MTNIRIFIVVMGLALALPICAEPVPLTLDQALHAAEARTPNKVLSSTRGIPYRQMPQPTITGLAPRDAARIEVMARFYEVILLDLEAVALGERMTVAYGYWEQLKSRATGASETADTLRAQLAYRDLYSRRNAARMHQRLARSALAITMGQPEALPAELVEPEFIEVDTPAPEALEANPRKPGDNNDAVLQDHAYTAAMLELDWLMQSEKPRVKVRRILTERLLDEALAQHSAGKPANLGDAMAAIVEVQKEERRVTYAIQLVREKLVAFASSRN